MRVESNANEAELVYIKLNKTQRIEFQLKKNNSEEMFWLFFPRQFTMVEVRGMPLQ